MTLTLLVRRSSFVLAAILLIALAWNGIRDGTGQWSQSHTVGQSVQTVTQVGYGVLALLSLATAFWLRSWNKLVLTWWVVCLSVSAGIASVAWGETSLMTGVAAAAAALLIAFAIAWLLRVGISGWSRLDAADSASTAHREE